MKIAVDISPIQDTYHQVRGVGMYIIQLKRYLEKQRTGLEYDFFTGPIPRADLVHFPYFDPFQRAVKPVQGVKTVITVHDLTPIVYKKHFPVGIRGNLNWNLNKRTLQQVEHIITDSSASAEDVIRLANVKKENVTPIYLGASDQFKQLENGKWKTEIKQKYNLPDTFALYVGDVTWNKNLVRLVQAIKQVNITLVMVGKALVSEAYDASHPWNKELAATQAEIKNDKRFNRLGFVEEKELVALYNMAEVFVMPSVYEGFGLPVLEAMQSGCPVVTTKGGSLAEVAGDAAYYVDPMDVSSIANGIGEVAFTPKVRESMREKGLVQAKKFSWEKTAEQTAAVYSSLLT